jgi:serine/threonine-protein kinase
LTVEAKLSLMLQVAEGLSHAHKCGILHRDLGPAKIHLTADGKVKIRDFAIASVLWKHLPHPWIRFGTPIYLSPEQIQQKTPAQPV